MFILYISVLLLCRYLLRGGFWFDFYGYFLVGDENFNSIYFLILLILC